MKCYRLLWLVAQAKGLTQRDLSRIANVDRSTITRFLKGQRDIPDEKLDLLIDKLEPPEVMATKIMLREQMTSDYLLDLVLRDIERQLKKAPL